MGTQAGKDLVAWAEELRPFASHERVLSDSSIVRIREFAAAIEIEARGDDSPCKFRLANAWHCITHDSFWNPNSDTCHNPLLTPRPSLGGGLDVDRLARAIAYGSGLVSIDEKDEWYTTPRILAEAIAREYANAKTASE